MADHKEYWSTESDQGSIRISEDVVASIAALSASETKRRKRVRPASSSIRTEHETNVTCPE